MKNLVWAIILFVPNILFSQNKVIGINYSFNQNQYIYFGILLNDFGTDGEGSYDIGISYLKPISKRFSIMIDAQYSQQKVITNSFNDGYDHFNHYVLKIINFPLSLKYDFSKYFFGNIGISYSKDISKSRVYLDNQTGFGAQVGIGGQLSVNSLYFALNPEIKLYSLIPWVDNDYQYHAIEAGIKIISGYKF